MLVPDNSALIRDSDCDIGIFVQYDTLAGEAAFYTRVYGPINKILLFIRYFFQKAIAFFDVHMTGRARADPTTVMVQVNIIFFCNFQNRLIEKIATDRFGCDARIFK